MYSVLVVLAVLAAILLILIVLIQESKGGGLASSFSSSNQIMGVRKTTDVVEKATWTLVALLVVFSVATAFTTSTTEDEIQKTLDMAPTGANSTVPADNAGE